MRLEVLAGELAICRLDPGAPLPAWARGELVATVRSGAELTVVCDAAAVPTEVRAAGDEVRAAGDGVSAADEEVRAAGGVPVADEEVRAADGWRALRVAGPLDLGLTGVLAALLVPLAEREVPIFAVCSYDTDYVLVPAERLGAACGALEDAGHEISGDRPA